MAPLGRVPNPRPRVCEGEAERERIPPRVLSKILTKPRTPNSTAPMPYIVLPNIRKPARRCRCRCRCT
eukprot:scaffold33617_cov129-Skeletonema_dohrnii-CCMP3373.AAC.2